MGKRSNFQRVDRDFYPTPESAVIPLLPHLRPGASFIEPCAGDGALIDHLTAHGYRCVLGADVCPLRDDIQVADVMGLTACRADADCFITNPPWSRDILHPMIRHLSSQLPTWLLFDADWMHTRQSAEFMPLLRKVVSVGRVKWIKDSPHTGKDNAAWYLFDALASGPTIFIGGGR